MANTATRTAVLNQFVRFVEAYGLRGLLFELLATNPTLLELGDQTLDASTSPRSADRRPQLLEEINRDKNFNQPRSIAGTLCSDLNLSEAARRISIRFAHIGKGKLLSALWNAGTPSESRRRRSFCGVVRAGPNPVSPFTKQTVGRRKCNDCPRSENLRRRN